MENKPFDLQSPVKIASEYGGNKQKIAQASKMGLVDPTAALLAGMFIDRMRSAQQAEMTPQQTVADQVFSPQPPPPPPPMGAPPQGGIGAAPPPPMGGAPMPPPQGGPPVGMAMGGLTTLPVPDSMFDEPSNGGYAGGGIVAFRSAGEVRARWERIIRDPKSTTKEREAVWRELTAAKQTEQVEPDNVQGFIPRGVGAVGDFLAGGQDAARMAGMANAAQAPGVRDTARLAFGYNKLTDPLESQPSQRPYTGPVVPAADAAGTPAAPAMAPAMAPAQAPAMAPAAASRPARNPGANSGLAAAAAAAATNKTPPTGDTAPAAPAPAPAKARTIEDIMKENENLAGISSTEDKAYTDELKKRASPETQAADKKQAMWEALTQFGLNLASSKSPSFIQAVGEAGNATLPSLQAAEKERKAALKDTVKEIRENERYSNTEKRQRVASAIAQSEQEKTGIREDAQLAHQIEKDASEMAFKDKQLKSEERRAAAAIAGQLAAAIAGRSASAEKLTDAQQYAKDYVASEYRAGMTPQEIGQLKVRASIFYQKLQRPPTTSPLPPNIFNPAGSNSRPAAGNYGAIPKGAVTRVN